MAASTPNKASHTKSWSRMWRIAFRRSRPAVGTRDVPTGLCHNEVDPLMPKTTTLAQDADIVSESPASPNEPAESFGDILSQFERSHAHPAEEGPLEGTVIAVSGDSISIVDIAKMLRSRLGVSARRMLRFQLPAWLLRRPLPRSPGHRRSLPQQTLATLSESHSREPYWCR